MNRKIVVPLILFLTFLLLTIFFIPIKQAFIFIEYRTDTPRLFYVLLNDDDSFQIRYVHSIHLTDVIESYEVTKDGKIRMVSMTYENLAIGLPGAAEEGETFSVKDGKYTLSYDNNVIDSFTMRIGDVDADLAFRYRGHEINLKQQLERGMSYTFRVTKLSCFQMLRGVNIDGKRKKA